MPSPTHLYQIGPDALGRLAVYEFDLYGDEVLPTTLYGVRVDLDANPADWPEAMPVSGDPDLLNLAELLS